MKGNIMEKDRTVYLTLSLMVNRPTLMTFFPSTTFAASPIGTAIRGKRGDNRKSIAGTKEDITIIAGRIRSSIEETFERR